MAQKPSQHRPPNPESLVARYEHGAQNYANAKEVARKSTDTLQAAQAQLASALRTGDPTQIQKAEGAVSWWTNNYNFAQNLVTNAKTRVMADSDRIDRHRTVQERRLKDAVTRGFPKESPARNLPQEIYDKINDVHYPKLPKSQFDPS